MFQGFLPKDTAIHHRSVVLDLIREALDEAAIKDPKAEIDAVAFTKVSSVSDYYTLTHVFFIRTS